METFSEILDAIHKPLSFAARDGYARIGRVKGLEHTIPTLAGQGAARAGSELARRALGELLRTFADYPRLDANGRRAAIDRGLELVRRARAAETSAPSRALEELKISINRFKGGGRGCRGEA